MDTVGEIPSLPCKLQTGRRCQGSERSKALFLRCYQDCCRRRGRGLGRGGRREGTHGRGFNPRGARLWDPTELAGNPTVQCWASHSTSLSLCQPIWKVGPMWSVPCRVAGESTECVDCSLPMLWVVSSSCRRGEEQSHVQACEPACGREPGSDQQPHLVAAAHGPGRQRTAALHLSTSRDRFCWVPAPRARLD